MKVTKNINFSRFKDRIVRKEIKHLQNFTKIVKDTVDDITPVLTWRLLSNTKSVAPYVFNNHLISIVYNDTEYIKEVEYWMWMIFNYHNVDRKVIYRWDWMWMFWNTYLWLKWHYNFFRD